jgi:hypothetical protein
MQHHGEVGTIGINRKREWEDDPIYKRAMETLESRYGDQYRRHEKLPPLDHVLQRAIDALVEELKEATNKYEAAKRFHELEKKSLDDVRDQLSGLIDTLPPVMAVDEKAT